MLNFKLRKSDWLVAWMVWADKKLPATSKECFKAGWDQCWEDRDKHDNESLVNVIKDIWMNSPHSDIDTFANRLAKHLLKT